MSYFNLCFDKVVGVEGGYCNHPKDPGGETKYGITARDYPNVDIKNLKLEDAKEIYKRDYWDKCKADMLKWPLCLYVFDCTVNQGPGAAIKLLQKLCGITEDGIIGRGTITAANQLSDDKLLEYLSLRAMRYVGTKNFDTFGLGWFNRLFRIVVK